MPNFSIFISRNQEDVHELSTWCNSQNLVINSKSLIEFAETSFTIPKNWDVIFFPSPRAVDFFFRQYTNFNFSTKKFASAGKGTALALQKWVDKVDFVPKNPGKIKSGVFLKEKVNGSWTWKKNHIPIFWNRKRCICKFYK